MDVKDADLGAFDPSIPEEGPATPPAGWLDDVRGYKGHKAGGHVDGVTLEGIKAALLVCLEEDDPSYPPPPAYTPQPEPNRNTLVPSIRLPTVSEDVAREALLKFVESKWTYSSKPARNLSFNELKSITVYRYRLETYTETRTSTWQFEPYNGQMVDGPPFGSSPAPWDIPVSTPQRYSDVEQKVVVPHSSFVKTCHRCRGCGKTRCGGCGGRGQKRCTFCHGHGRSRRKSCTSCHGRGRRRWEPRAAASSSSLRADSPQRLSSCFALVSTPAPVWLRCFVLSSALRCCSCHGHGFRTCVVCHGSQNLMHFIQLTVTWKNNVDDFIPDRQPNFPDKKFDKVSGDPFFVDENVLVYPIQGFPDQEICDVSMKLINEHLNRYISTSRILQQRQTIELVPLTHAFYSYGGKGYSFYVYGTENRVFTSKYPSACAVL